MTGKELGRQPAGTCFVDGGPGDRELVAGLTKREAFAMAAMQSQLSKKCDLEDEEYLHWVASTAINAADALLEELAK